MSFEHLHTRKTKNPCSLLLPCKATTKIQISVWHCGHLCCWFRGKTTITLHSAFVTFDTSAGKMKDCSNAKIWCSIVMHLLQCKFYSHVWIDLFMGLQTLTLFYFIFHFYWSIVVILLSSLPTTNNN